MMLNLGEAHLDQAMQIYSSPYPGAVEIAHALKEDARRALAEEMRRERNRLQSQNNNYVNGVRQRMSTAYYEDEKLEHLAKDFRTVSALRDEYQRWYSRLAKFRFLYSEGINSVGVHRYDAGNIGITPHQDNLSSINAISIFVIDGEAPFYTCTHRNAEHRTYFKNKPGSLIILRAHRYKLEEGVRPLHAVGLVEHERHVVCMREHVNIESGNLPLSISG